MNGKIKTFWALIFLISACSFKISEKHLSLGNNFEQRGQYKRALEEYQKVININEKPQLVNSALEKSAFINFRYIRDYQKAVELFKEVYEKSPEQDKKIQAMEMLSEIYSEYLNDTNASLEWQTKLFNDFGKHLKNADQQYLAYSEKLIESARYNRAIVVYDEFLKKFPAHSETPRVMIHKGEAYAALGETDEAKKAYQEIVETFSNNPDKRSLVAEAYYGLGMSFERDDNLDKALDFYEKSLDDYPNREVVEIKISGINRRKKLRGLR